MAKAISRKRRALAELVAGRSISETAKIIGVSRQTLSRWINQDVAFRDELRQAQAEALSQAVRLCTDGLVQSIAQLRLLMTTSANEGIRLRSADAILARYPGLASIGDIDARLRELEERKNGH